jgi:predicted phosphodiesterase
MVASEAGDGAHAVEERHVQVEHCGVGRKLLDELDCGQPVRRRPDDGELMLVTDQVPQRGEKYLVVVGKQNSDLPLGDRRRHRGAISSLLERDVKQPRNEPFHSREMVIDATLSAVLGVLYDIHGNLPALERVLAEAEQLDIDRWLLGGDYGTPSPWPDETLARLKELPQATWIRGNGERWLREPPLDRPEVMESYDVFRGSLSEEVVDWLYTLPTQAELDGILYVHGSPLSDVDSFPPEPSDDDGRMLAGISDRTVVFGHSHQQFRREGPNGTDLVNPGSVGMPLDGDVRAAWATWDGDFEFRRTEYDVARAAAGYRSMGGDFGEFASRRIERGSD